VSCLLMLAVAVIFAIRARAITHATGQPATTTVATSSR
jgi:hypothetical protein